MTGLPSTSIAERYRLRLSAAWREWFDNASGRLPLIGQFRAPIKSESLLSRRPKELWAGFMLPDTLPIVSNEYGDWFCVRIGREDSIAEILQWHHGGGDWIPFGRSIAEAFLFDAVCLFRPDLGHCAVSTAQRVDRSSDESRAGSPFGSSRLSGFIEWTAHQLNCPYSDVEQIYQLAGAGGFARSLELMYQREWASFAVAYEQILGGLQSNVSRLASPSIASAIGVAWEPDYIQWLFDNSLVPANVNDRLTAKVGSVDSMMAQLVNAKQDWNAAEHAAAKILQARQDLGWAFDVAAWSAFRRGQLETAAEYCFAGRYASSFSDQSIRMRSHWFEPRFGKFTIALFDRIGQSISIDRFQDEYLDVVKKSHPTNLKSNVREYWLTRARHALASNEPNVAYENFYRAGWDLGAERLTDYMDILRGLVESAQKAGWSGRAAVAQAHLDVLSGRILPGSI